MDMSSTYNLNHYSFFLFFLFLCGALLYFHIKIMIISNFTPVVLPNISAHYFLKESTHKNGLNYVSDNIDRFFVFNDTAILYRTRTLAYPRVKNGFGTAMVRDVRDQDSYVGRRRIEVYSKQK